MLSQAQRTTILELSGQQVSKREIARVLGISRVAVRKVLRANSAKVPEIQRPEKTEPYRQQILELFDTCQGTWCESMRNWWPEALSCRMPR